MLKIMKHRAPDDEGIIDDGKFAMGMGRLAIIDLKSEGLCPYQEGNLVLSYNGEIYNYIELREELRRKGYAFKTDSDTEVVLKSYIEWGEACLERFNGMFALAIYDGESVFLARDIAGEKPLYYREQDFSFASEAKALKSDIVESEFCEHFQHCLEETLYRGVRELLPAMKGRYSLDTGIFRISYWWRFIPRHIHENTAEEELEWLIEDAVRLRTRADVPYALYYSGGIDSSLIKSAYSFEREFTYEGTTAQKFFRDARRMSYHLDFPVGSFSAYALWTLAEQASREVKVVLSGEGADELFGGYARYLPVAREYEMRNAYPSYGQLFDKATNSYAMTYASLTARTSNIEYVMERAKPLFRYFDPITAMQFFDFKFILPSLLQMGDRMASAFGLENRCPFLDRRIIEFGLSLPSHLKIKGTDTKVLLRRIAKKHGIDIAKEKHGLVVPFNQWSGIHGYDRTEYFKYLKQQWLACQ